jgi:hypothetical protein
VIENKGPQNKSQEVNDRRIQTVILCGMGWALISWLALLIVNLNHPHARLNGHYAAELAHWTYVKGWVERLSITAFLVLASIWQVLWWRSRDAWWQARKTSDTDDEP